MVSASSSGAALAEAEGFVPPVPAAGFVALVAGAVVCVLGEVVAPVVGVVAAGVVVVPGVADVPGAVVAGGCVWPVEGFCLLSSA